MKKRKPKLDATDRLHYAIGSYVKDRGGSVAVSGPIKIQRYPLDRPFKFEVVIECLGRLPPKKKVEGNTK